MLANMYTVFVVIGSIFVFVAAVIHLFIFFLESVLWSRPSTWKRFGLKTQAEADTVQPMAYNQGFYNVFLALGAGAGLVMMASTNVYQGGVALSIFALLSMLLASIVLITSSPKLWRSALIQGVAPFFGILFLVLALASG
jgi:putative membrane protein